MLPFKLWVDADALPKILREVILRASDRYQLEVTFVANQNVGITPSIRIKSIQVMSGADRADQEIVERMQENDIVITQDIPLAAQVIEKGGIAIHPRGEIYTTANVKARLHLRDFMDTLRGAGVQTGGPPPISERDKREFSSSLDQTILKQNVKLLAEHAMPSRLNLMFTYGLLIFIWATTPLAIVWSVSDLHPMWALVIRFLLHYRWQLRFYYF